MKKFILNTAVLLFTLGMYSQNTNVKTEEKITTTTIKDSKGEQKIVKKEIVSEKQDIEFVNAESTKTNKDMKPTEINVTTTKQIIVDGETKSFDVDHSSYYDLDGTKYEIKSDKKGYVLLNRDKKTANGVLRKTQNNSYIFRTKDKVSVGYFDTKGNLILETYDPKTDSMILEKFVIEN
jgi:hypothetical protein